MSFFKCESCGHIFEEGEEKINHILLAEAWGRPIYEKLYLCPICGGEDYSNAKMCKSCNRVFTVDELSVYNGHCEDCAKDKAKEYKYRPDVCYKISKKHNLTESVEIDQFLSIMFSPEQINEVLYKELLQSTSIAPVDCTNFINIDDGWFIDTVLEWGE